MSERLTTLACALGAAALFLLLFVHREGGLDRRNDVPRPTTVEERGAGYRGLFEWLNSSGLRTLSLRERIDSLIARSDIPHTGNVLLVTLPGTDLFKTVETGPLQDWLHEGNTLLLLAALADSPDWAVAVGGVNVGDLKLLSGINFTPSTTPKSQTRTTAVLGAARAHAYFSGVRRAVATSSRPAEEWSARIPADGFMLVLGRDPATGAGLLWTRSIGSGRIIVSGLGSMFTDEGLRRANNAQLLANIIAVNLAAGGTVIFDDFHQGLAALYDPQKFYRDPRLYSTAAILFGLWLSWVLGGTRLRVPETRIAAPREVDLVRANGGFLARVLSPDAAARALFEHFARRASVRRGHLTQTPLQCLLQGAQIGEPELGRLTSWHAKAYAGERVPLVALYNLLLRMERKRA